MKPKRMNPEELVRRAQQAKESLAALKSTKKAEAAARRANPIVKKRTTPPEHGQHIYVYNHLQKNHVVYSLTKAMNNNAALAQLPFNGKKSVPAALRKDLWHPFAQITFPKGAGSIGLSAFQKLREYRKRHELEWGDEIFKDDEGKLRKRKDRNRMICDQKANSVADMAAVLSRLAGHEKPGESTATEGAVQSQLAEPERPGEGTATEGSVQSRLTEHEKPAEGTATEGSAVPATEGEKKVEAVPSKKLPNIGLIGEGSGTQVQVLWRDLHDAEFAETWAENVEHGVLPLPTVVTPPWLAEKLRRKKEMEMTEGERQQLRRQKLIESRADLPRDSKGWEEMNEEERQASKERSALRKQKNIKIAALEDAKRKLAARGIWQRRDKKAEMNVL